MQPHPLFAKFVAAGIRRRDEIARSVPEVASQEAKVNNLN
jgi:hypothetical protein